MEAHQMFLIALAKSTLLSMAGLSVAMGLAGVINPRLFSAAVNLGNRWVDTWKIFGIPETSKWRALDRWVDVDRYALCHSRLAGLAMCAAGVFLGYLGMTLMGS